MTAQQLVNHMIPTLKPSDDVAKAKQWMDEFRLKELPVVENEEFSGFFTEDLLYDADIMNHEIGSYALAGAACYVSASTHYYDIIKLQRRFGLDLTAVVDQAGGFQGVVLSSDLMKSFSQTAIVNSDGAIVVLKTTLEDYSLAEITRVVEMNEATILGLNVRPDEGEPSNIELVLRISQQDISQIITGLTGLGYKVASLFNSEDRSFNEHERFGLLMKFLDA